VVASLLSTTRSRAEALHTLQRTDWLFLLGLFVALAITRVPLWADVPYNSDATALVEALAGFDIAHHRPHPPGYLFYVLFGRLLASVVEAKLAYLLLSLLFSWLTLFFAYRLAIDWSSRSHARAVVALALLGPVFWFYGIVGESYAAEAALSVAAAWLLWRALTGRHHALVWAALLIGLGGGVRSSIQLFLAPLFLFVLWRAPASWRAKLGALGVAVAATVVWLLPTVTLAGGFARYQTIGNGLIVGVHLASYSPFLGGPEWALNLQRVLSWWATSWVPLFLLFPFALFRSTDHEPGPALRVSPFFLFWVVPALVFCLLGFASKPGYLLFAFPAGIALAGRVFSGRKLARRHELARWALVCVLLAGQFIWFVGKHDAGAMTLAGFGRHPAINDFVARAYGKRLFADPQRAFLFYNAGWSWRVAAYLYPRRPIIVLYDGGAIPAFRGGRIEACSAYRGKLSCASGDGFWLRRVSGQIRILLPSSVRSVTLLSPQPSTLKQKLSLGLGLQHHRRPLPWSQARVQTGRVYQAGAFVFELGERDTVALFAKSCRQRGQPCE
jgi:hypothetical protein